VLFAAGAREVLTGVPWSPTVASVEELDDLIATTDIRAMHLAAFHPTGSVRAGADPERYPVDPEGRLRGIEGVWVADASIHPSCPEVNPQVTIMALAQSVASVMV
jgi:choline dehydrogenase-like flavoprotein